MPPQAHAEAAESDIVTEDEARALCAELGATFSIRKRRGIPYVYVARWLPRRAVEALGWKSTTSNGQQFDRYVCPLSKLPDLDAETLRERIAVLPTNPNKHEPEAQELTGGAEGGLADAHLTDAALELLATIPPKRTGILTWAKDATARLAIPREQLAYRLAVYLDDLAAAGVRLAQVASQDIQTQSLFIPRVGQDAGAYYSHIWKEASR
jgi:hypothetical protein